MQVLYLFNSAYRALYLRNVLNTLYLPSGSTNDYRYGPNNTDASLTDGLKAGDSVQIVFADRFHTPGYEYHAIRRGEFVRAWERDGYLFFTVQLDDFVYATDPVTFNMDLAQKACRSRLPQLTSGDPWNSNDGIYAVCGEDVLAAPTSYHTGDLAWTECVDALSKCRSFGAAEPRTARSNDDADFEALSPARPDREFVFLHSELRDSRGVSELASMDGNRGIFELERGKRIDLELSYRYSQQKSDTFASTQLTWHSGDRVTPLGNSVVNVESAHNTVRQSFTTLKHSDECLDAIWLTFEGQHGEATVIGPDACIQVKVVQGRLFWPRVIAALTIFTVAGVLATGDIGKIWSPLPMDATLSGILQKAAGTVLQASSVWWMANLLGKKLL
jgi:hypothetical protein